MLKNICILVWIALYTLTIAQEQTPPPPPTTTPPPPPPPPPPPQSIVLSRSPLTQLMSHLSSEIEQYFSLIISRLKKYCPSKIVTSSSSNLCNKPFKQMQKKVSSFLQGMQNKFCSIQQMLQQFMQRTTDNSPPSQFYFTECEADLKLKKTQVVNHLRSLEQDITDLPWLLRNYFLQNYCPRTTTSCTEFVRGQQQSLIYHRVRLFQQAFPIFYHFVTSRYLQQIQCLKYNEANHRNQANRVATTTVPYKTFAFTFPKTYCNFGVVINDNGTLSGIENVTQVECDFTRNCCQTKIDVDANGKITTDRQCKQTQGCENNAQANTGAFKRCYPGNNNIRQCWFCCSSDQCNDFLEIPEQNGGK